VKLDVHMSLFPFTCFKVGTRSRYPGNCNQVPGY